MAFSFSGSPTNAPAAAPHGGIHNGPDLEDIQTDVGSRRLRLGGTLQSNVSLEHRILSTLRGSQTPTPTYAMASRPAPISYVLSAEYLLTQGSSCGGRAGSSDCRDNRVCTKGIQQSKLGEWPSAALPTGTSDTDANENIAHRFFGR